MAGSPPSVFDEHLLHERAVFSRRASFLLAEDADEVGLVVEAAAVADFGHGGGSVGQHLAGLGDAQVVDVVDESVVGLLFEKVAEGRFGHADQAGYVAQLDGFFEVGLQVVADLGDAAAFGAAHGVVGVILVAYQETVVGYGQVIQDGQEGQHGVEALHAGQPQDFVFDALFGGFGKADAFLCVQQELLDGGKEAFLQDGEIEQLVGELDGHHVVAFHDFSAPGMRQVGARHHEVEGGEVFFGISYDAFAVGIHDQVDFILGVVVYGVVKLGIRMIQHDEEVVGGNGGNFFLQILHDIGVLMSKQMGGMRLWVSSGWINAACRHLLIRQ